MKGAVPSRMDWRQTPVVTKLPSRVLSFSKAPCPGHSTCRRRLLSSPPRQDNESPCLRLWPPAQTVPRPNSLDPVTALGNARPQTSLDLAPSWINGTVCRGRCAAVPGPAALVPLLCVTAEQVPAPSTRGSRARPTLSCVQLRNSVKGGSRLRRRDSASVHEKQKKTDRIERPGPWGAARRGPATPHAPAPRSWRTPSKPRPPGRAEPRGERCNGHENWLRARQTGARNGS